MKSLFVLSLISIFFLFGCRTTDRFESSAKGQSSKDKKTSAPDSEKDLKRFAYSGDTLTWQRATRYTCSRMADMLNRIKSEEGNVFYKAICKDQWTLTSQFIFMVEDKPKSKYVFESDYGFANSLTRCEEDRDVFHQISNRDVEIKAECKLGTEIGNRKGFNTSLTATVYPSKK